MEMTVAQFLNQNKVWHDKNYWYAIHITDGGAMYLYQIYINDLKNKNADDKIKIYSKIRFDGVDFYKFVDNVEEQIKENLR